MREPIHPKVKAAGTAGALSILLAGALSRAGVELTAVEATALTTVLSGAAGWLKRS